MNTIDRLIDLAILAIKNAYSPYSNFKVGAAIEMDDGSIYTGCNIENSSYGLTVCAERVAIFKAVSEGKRKIRRIILLGDSEFTMPCGTCRQVMREFGVDMEIIVVKSINEANVYKTYYLSDLLPNSFGPMDILKRS